MFKLFSFLPTKLYLQIRSFIYKTLKGKYYTELQEKRLFETTDSYSFKPFDDHQAIFIHIPKAAGVSVSNALFGNLAGGHTRLEMHLNIFEPSCILNYFKFTIVRNPWDRLVSAYHFLQKGGFEKADKDWFDKELSAYKDFDDFVKNWLNKENIWKWHHFRPQYHYMLDDNRKVKLDFIGFIENMDEDFEYIRKKLGVESTIKKLNKSDHKDYKDYYTEETKNIVAEVYAEDIELLGYNFDNSSLPTQLLNRMV